MEKNTTYSTEQLIEELSKRTGVEKITAEPSKEFSASTEDCGINGKGPAVILVVTI